MFLYYTTFQVKFIDYLLNFSAELLVFFAELVMITTSVTEQYENRHHTT